jgi:hypothetical protein
MSDTSLYDAECVVFTTLLVAFGLVWLVRGLERRRPDFALGRPIAIAFSLRVLVAAGVSLTSVAGTLRGGDELTFQQLAGDISASSFSSSLWTDALTSGLDQGGAHEVVFALQYKVLGSPEFALRVMQAGIAVVGLTLMACAVYDLAGPRAARLAAWILALEPASLFFSTLLHKEALLLLAEGLVAYGGAALWKRGRLTSLAPMAAGCLIALATRPYVGWFLIAACAAIVFHGSLRVRRRTPFYSYGVLMIALVVGILTAPIVWNASSHDALKRLQSSAQANATDASNLKLEQVSFSSREDIVLNLPPRLFDIVLKPYPWQLSNISQQFGALGSLVALALLALLVQASWRGRGTLLQRAGPLIYLGSCMLVAYALSVGNAGTGFRYRTHLVAIAICLVLVLRARQATTVTVRSEQPGAPTVPALAR